MKGILFMSAERRFICGKNHVSPEQKVPELYSFQDATWDAFSVRIKRSAEAL